MYDEKRMIRWFVDKNSDIPLYVQLKGLIKHYVSTEAMQGNPRLPTVKALAKELHVNFETVRKAYKDLEKEGLLRTRRGRGTFAEGHGMTAQIVTPVQTEADPLDLFKLSVKKLFKSGMPVATLQAILHDTVSVMESENSRQSIIFTECNELQVREISETLRVEMNMKVQPVLLSDLRKTVEKIHSENQSLLAVITTGFHVNEVRNLVADFRLKVDFVITNMSPRTRRLLDGFDKSARYGLICRDPVQMHFFKELVKSELAIESEILSCTLNESERIAHLLKSVDVLLLSPPVFEEIKRNAPPDLPLFNVIDRVDPLSLKLMRERLLEAV